MSVAIHEQEALHQYEVSVDTFEDLVGFSGELGRLLTGRVIEIDSEIAAELQELRNQVVEEVIRTLDGEREDKMYTFEVEEMPFVRDAIQLAKQKIEPPQLEPDPAFAWLSDPHNTHAVNVVPIKPDASRPLFKE